MTDTAALPDHIEQSVQSIAKLHADHARRATRLERTVEHLTELIARPAFIGVLTVCIIAWIGGNLLARYEGWSALDAPPFNWLADAISMAALYVTALILTTQRRDEELADQRDQMTLQLAIVTEQKVAKVIELLEEMRRDDTGLRNRVDREADAMSVATDSTAVLNATDKTQL